MNDFATGLRIAYTQPIARLEEALARIGAFLAGRS